MCRNCQGARTRPYFHRRFVEGGGTAGHSLRIKHRVRYEGRKDDFYNSDNGAT